MSEYYVRPVRLQQTAQDLRTASHSLLREIEEIEEVRVKLLQMKSLEKCATALVKCRTTAKTRQQQLNKLAQALEQAAEIYSESENACLNSALAPDTVQYAVGLTSDMLASLRPKPDIPYRAAQFGMQTTFWWQEGARMAWPARFAVYCSPQVEWLEIRALFHAFH